MAHRLKLVSFELCPYVERSRIVLLEKHVPHDVAFIDLANKPDWFLRISPMGRVPVLLVDDRPVFESMVINELIDELYPEPPLMPRDPLARAEARGWVVFANDAVFPPSFAAMVAIAGGATGDALAGHVEKLRDALGKLDARLTRASGPFLAGPTFSLADAAFTPFFRRWRTVEGWGTPEARLLGAFPAVSAWADALLARASARAAEPPGFAEKLRRSLEERAARARST